MISDALLARLWPHADPNFLQILLIGQTSAYALGGISGPMALAHFWAQCSHECAAGTALIENMNYSADRLMEVWPKRFPDIASTVGFSHDPHALGNKVYNGRMGNAMGTNDGYNFRARGLIQTTGRDNYHATGIACGLDLIDNPDLAADPHHALTVACGTWKRCDAEPWAEKDDLLQVTRKTNGGLTGLASRRTWLSKWKDALY